MANDLTHGEVNDILGAIRGVVGDTLSVARIQRLDGFVDRLLEDAIVIKSHCLRARSRSRCLDIIRLSS